MRGSTLLILGSAILIGFFYRDFTGESLTKTLYPNTGNAINNEAHIGAVKNKSNDLPIVDKMWMMGNNRRMIYHYKLNTSSPSQESMIAIAKNRACLYHDDGIVEFVFMDSTGWRVLEYSVDTSTCD